MADRLYFGRFVRLEMRLWTSVGAHTKVHVYESSYASLDVRRAIKRVRSGRLKSWRVMT